MSADSRQQYTAEVEYSLPETDDTRKRTASYRTVNGAKDRAVDKVPLDANIWRVGVWTGTVSDRPESGHEEGLDG